VSRAYRHPPRAPEHGWLGLVAAIVASTPKLEGASCRGRAGLFDAAIDNQTRRARSICFACPALDACRSWAETEPRVMGVLATEYRRFSDDRRRAETRRAAMTND
jgi:hypothetical protein